MKYRIKERYGYYYIQKKNLFKWNNIKVVDFVEKDIESLRYNNLEEAICMFLFLSGKNKAKFKEIKIK